MKLVRSRHPVKRTTKRVFQVRADMFVGELSAALEAIPAEARIVDIEREEPVMWGGSPEAVITAELIIEEETE